MIKSENVKIQDTFFIDIGNNLVKQSNCPCDQCFNNGYGSCCCPNDKANEGKVENKAQEWQCRSRVMQYITVAV